MKEVVPFFEALLLEIKKELDQRKAIDWLSIAQKKNKHSLTMVVAISYKWTEWN